jgi:hypothetical protein
MRRLLANREAPVRAQPDEDDVRIARVEQLGVPRSASNSAASEPLATGSATAWPRGRIRRRWPGHATDYAPVGLAGRAAITVAGASAALR